jgi:hypothetical protein
MTVIVVAAYCRGHPNHWHPLRFTRAFHAFPKVHAPEDTVVKRPRPLATLTKKLFSELPKRRVLECPAPPALCAEVTPRLPPVDNLVPSRAHFIVHLPGSS